MKEKRTMSTRPGLAKAPPAAADSWVQDAPDGGPKMRLTIDIPADLHGRIKGSCARRNKKMVVELTALLEEKYPPGC